MATPQYAPYWGKLPAVSVTRGNSVKRERQSSLQGNHDLAVDIGMVEDRSSGQFQTSPHRKQNRISTQTDAPTVSTQSPFVSPTDSTFGAAGLAPRPPSFPYTAPSNNDYLDKRRRRESKNKEQAYQDQVAPPTAPEAPRAPPPVSYKRAYDSVPASSEYQPPTRARSSRRSEGPVSSSQGVADEYFRSNRQGDYLERGQGSRRVSNSNGKAAVRPHENEWDSSKPEKIDTPHRSRRQHSVPEAETQRREWAPDKSPLQRLELTLDNITKEEKRARVEEAERLAKEKVRSTDKAPQSSVHFRNRLGAKAPEAGSKTVTRSLQDDLSTQAAPRHARKLQRSATLEKRPVVATPPDTNTTVRGLESEQPPEISHVAEISPSGPKRGNSIRDRSYIPVPVSISGGVEPSKLGRSGSNKLRKEPPGDPWLHRRVEAETKYQEVTPRGPSIDQQTPGPSRDTAFRNNSRSVSVGKELPILPQEARHDPEYLDSDTPGDMGPKPVRRGTLSKLERLAGRKLPIQVQPPIESKPNEHVVKVNGTKYDVTPSRSGTVSHNATPHESTEHHRHLPHLLHRKHDGLQGQTVYTPTPRLDEWKKGGVAQLSGSLLDLDIDDQNELEKDKTWWEAGHSGRRRRSTTKQRKAEAYDGEYDDSNAPTRFKPPLFLRSGPSLRYCGLRREPITNRSVRPAGVTEREIWRGSVMIVTQDDHSSYELAPTLRLFLQPTELLPPPPAQVDGEELAPEYIDPLAGLPKIGRDGRTLYIRPIDHLDEERDLSKEESDEGLFETERSPLDGVSERKCTKPHYDGEKAGKYKEVRGFRLHAEQGVTFWRFNLEIELREKQQRMAYRINRGPATGFWVPARGQPMNIMFHSCNGFSYDVDPHPFNGPDPMWRDVLNTHQTQPFHVMLGGGDQIYNDIVMVDTKLFREWTEMKDPHHKEIVPFKTELQNELESFYMNRYCTWFSQGLFGLATSQIPMINIFDDHDIIDGYGSYPDDYMRSPVMRGLGAIAFKYYMLFQHQSSIDEGEETEPHWILGEAPGPYIGELSRSIFTHLGRSIAFLGLDCRTERMNDEIVSAETYNKVFDRLEKDIIKGETKHLIVLVGIPVAYPRMVWLENILTSKIMDPIKALGRAGLLGKNLLNHFDGGVEILDDLDDHWTAKHHKDERNWLIQELQDLAAEKSIRVTILGGDVHLAAIGQFYSNPKLGIPKDQDHRYMPNVISSAIVNAPPPDTLADVLNKRNKVHHLDSDTEEDMIPIFTHDVTGKPRNNKRLLNRRNWCSIRAYDPEFSPPPTPQTDGSPTPPPSRGGLLRRFSTSRPRGPSYRPDTSAPPLSSASFFNRRPSTARRNSSDSQRPGFLTRTLSLTRRDSTKGSIFRRNSKKKDSGGINGYGSETDDDYDDAQYDSQPRMTTGLRGGSGGSDEGSYFPAMDQPCGREPENSLDQASTSVAGAQPQKGFVKPQFFRTPTAPGQKSRRGPAEVNLEGGLDICLNVEVSHKDPAGITMPYRLLVPALFYHEEHKGEAAQNVQSGMQRWLSFGKAKKKKETQIRSAFDLHGG